MTELVTVGDILDGKVETFDLLLFSSEAEKGLLCSLLKDGHLFEDVSNVGLRIEDFYFAEHQIIFRAIQELALAELPIDGLAVFDKCPADYKYAVELSEIMEIENLLPSTGHVVTYAQIIKEKKLYRKLNGLGIEISKMAKLQKGNPKEIITKAQDFLLSLDDPSRSTAKMDVRDMVMERLKHLADLHSGATQFQAVFTGFTNFDNIVKGFKPGELILIAGRPSMGKTAIALNMALNMAIKYGLGVGIVSLEMGNDALTDRFFSILSGVDIQRIQTGRMSEDEYRSVVKMASVLYDANLHVSDRAVETPASLRSLALNFVRKHDIKVLVIDYLQLLDPNVSRENKTVEVGEISKSLKAIAREFKITVIALSQLNRGVEGRVEKRPNMSDLRDSGSLEQDADMVVMIYRPEYYSRDATAEQDVGVTELIVSKNRNGPLGTARLRFSSHLTRFEDEPPHPEVSYWGKS